MYFRNVQKMYIFNSKIKYVTENYLHSECHIMDRCFLSLNLHCAFRAFILYKASSSSFQNTCQWCNLAKTKVNVIKQFPWKWKTHLIDISSIGVLFIYTHSKFVNWWKFNQTTVLFINVVCYICWTLGSSVITICSAIYSVHFVCLK